MEQGYAAILEENGFVVLRRLADPDAKDLIVSSLVEALPPSVTAKQKRAAKVNALDIHRKAMEWKRPRGNTLASWGWCGIRYIANCVSSCVHFQLCTELCTKQRRFVCTNQQLRVH